MLVDGVEWKLEFGGQTWTGKVGAWQEMIGHIGISFDPESFEMSVFYKGVKIHQSEHACLCEAQKAGSEAMQRAHDLRKGRE